MKKCPQTAPDMVDALTESLRLVKVGKAELPGKPGYDVVDECATCADWRARLDSTLRELAVTIRERDAARDLLRATQAQLAAERETTHVIPARETLPVSDPASDVALLATWREQQAQDALLTAAGPVAEALMAMRAAENEDGIDGAGNEVAAVCRTCEGGGRVVDGDDVETRCPECGGGE